MRSPRTNPFRVDRVSALSYLGGDVSGLIDRLLALGHAAIVGPHGVGKSTLMRAIGDALRERGVTCLAVNLPGSATREQREAALAEIAAVDTIAAMNAGTFILLDGYEQLTWPERRRVRRHRRLLVTAHRCSRLPTLVTLRPTTATLDAVLIALAVPPTPAAHAALRRHRGDVRETLMSLYDDWGAGHDF